MRLRAIALGFAICAFIMLDGLTGPAALAQARRDKPNTRPFRVVPPNPTPGDLLLDSYFEDRTLAIARASLADVKTAADWEAKRAEYRRELADMLGLWPMPERTDLKPTITGKVDHADFTVEKLHFQSIPGLYVTANLYIPKNLKGKAPTILYVCGHGTNKDAKTGVAYGSKTAYQHHGAWFAQNGYVCLIIDTLQLGEIEGIHHGLYRERMWWWISRGYTSAGVEAWNSMRALDYLETRPEVDASKFGITGRSGGGAYSWWTAALDERIQCAVPVAGITDLQNYVIDAAIEGHCDCMFMVNTYRWDFAKVAALVSPRALLISNTDKDRIFPLDGVERLHAEVRRIYLLQNADDKLGLLITEGGHHDTQELQVPAMKWFNRFLKNDKSPLTNFAPAKPFQPPELRVFVKNPEDQLNTKIQERFVPKAPPPAVPDDAAGWAKQREGWIKELSRQTFGAWPTAGEPPAVKKLGSTVRDGIEMYSFEVMSQKHVPVRLYLAVGAAQAKQPELVVLDVVDEAKWNKPRPMLKDGVEPELRDVLPDEGPEAAASLVAMLKKNNWAMAYVSVRGVGQMAWTGGEKRVTHIRRRYELIGESLDGMRAWDVRQAIRALAGVERLKNAPIWLQGEGRMAGIALYASLYEPSVARLDLWKLPATLDLTADGPELLNVLKVMDVPAAVAAAANHAKVRIYGDSARLADAWKYPLAVAKKLGWPEDRIQVREAK